MQRDTDRRDRRRKLSARAICPWVGVALGLGCTAPDPGGCREPTRRESAYPFTAAWSGGPDPGWCLFQPDAQSVTGRIGNDYAAGVVQPDGELILSVAGTGGVTVLSGRLRSRDTLVLELRTSNPAPNPHAAGTFVRQGNPQSPG